MLDAGLKAALKKKYGDEQVLVVPYSSTAKIHDKFCVTTVKKIENILADRRFVLRADAEYNQAWVQPIPYIVVINKNANKVYVTNRIAGEERLKDTLSLGAGGHINPVDTIGAINSWSVSLNAANRELNEELSLRFIKGTDLEYVGTVRDFMSTTSEHLGIVYIAKVSSAKVKEKDNLCGSWMNFVDLVNNYHKFESWARHIIDHMLESGSSKEKIIF